MQLVQYYEYWEDTNTLVKTIMSYKPNADLLYKSTPISIMGYSDLNEIELSDGTIEYVERFDNQILVA